jgi:hypothetical protein
MRRPSYLPNCSPPPFTAAVMVYMAVRIDALFSRRDPRPSELCGAFGMTRATAYRWRSRVHGQRTPLIGKAFDLAAKYRDHTPSIAELRANDGYSRAQALRVRAAFLAARGEPNG